MSNTNFYQRISGSSIQGNANVAIEPYNTLVITNNNELRLHDGNTAGGNLIAGGGSFATTSSLVNGNYTVSLSSSTGVLTLSTASTILGSGTDPNVYIETSTTTTNSIWTFGTNGELTLPSDTPVIKGAGTGTDVTILAQSTSSTSTWVFGADGTLTVPGAITSVNGVAAVLYASSGTAAIVSNYSGFNQLFVQDDGVYIQSSANNSGTTFTNWTFGTDGTTHFPGSVILAPTSQSITMQSDQYSQLMWMNADQTTGTNKMTNSDFYVESGNATLDIGYFDGAGVQKYTTWLWNADGALTFPQGGTLRVSAVPAHSYGAVGDKAGTLAFDGSYIYYCTADFSGSTQYPARTAIVDANGVDSGYLVPDSFQLPSIGWIVYYNNQTATINEVNNGGNPGYYTIFTDTPLFIPVNSDFYYGPAPTDNIWVKQAWGTTGSW